MAGIVYGNICATYGLDIPNTYTYTQYQMPKMANQGQGPVRTAGAPSRHSEQKTAVVM